MPQSQGAEVTGVFHQFKCLLIILLADPVSSTVGAAVSEQGLGSDFSDLARCKGTWMAGFIVLKEQ